MKRLKESVRFQRECLLPKYHQAAGVGALLEGGWLCVLVVLKIKSATSIWAKYVVAVAKSFPTLWHRYSSMPGFPVLHCLPEFAQIHVHWVSDAIQPSHPLPPSSPPAFNLSQHQGLFQWVGSLHQVAKVSELLLSTKPQAKPGRRQARY